MESIAAGGIEYRFFNNNYAVSRCGKVLRKLAPYEPVKHGKYLAAGHNLLHRAVAACWLADFLPEHHVHHKDHNKHNNHADNLECLTVKEHISDRHAGEFGHYIRSEETREKIRQYRTGRKMSEETKAKIRASLIDKPHNYPSERKPNSIESNEQRSLNHHRNLACRVFGVTYRSFAEASIATGIHRFTLRKRCLSKNFPEYEILSPIS